VKLKSEATPKVEDPSFPPQGPSSQAYVAHGERASARLLSATAEIATRGPAHQLKKEVQARTTLPFAPSSGDGLRSLDSLNQSGAGTCSARSALRLAHGHSPQFIGVCSARGRSAAAT
jgi:hypothetical protein